jgi:hypothetical protein
LKLAAETQDNAQRDFLVQAILTAARGGSKITQPSVDLSAYLGKPA